MTIVCEEKDKALSKYFENRIEPPWFKFDSDTGIQLDGYLDLKDLEKIVALMKNEC